MRNPVEGLGSLFLLVGICGSPSEGCIAIYDIAGTYLSTRLLFSSALASVLPPIDRGDVPSALGVLDGVWWREVLRLDADALRCTLLAGECGLQVGLITDPSAPFPIDIGDDGCPTGHAWYEDGYVDVDGWGRAVRPSVARPERCWAQPVPGHVHLIVRFLPICDVMRLSLLCMGWRQALPGLLEQRDRLVHLYGLAFEFVDPRIGLQHITQLLAARDAAEVAAAAALDDVIDEPLPPFVEQWSDGDSRDSSPPPPERAPAWLTDDYDLEDAMAAMELYRA